MHSTTSNNGHTDQLPEGQRKAVELLRQHWDEGLRHKLARAVAGGLLRGGFSVKAAERFLEAVATAADDEGVADRVEVVQATADKLKRKANVSGWPTVAKLLGADGDRVVRETREALGLPRKITLADLARHKALPIDFLRGLGLHDLPEGGVGIPYARPDGGSVVKRRFGLVNGYGKGSWPAGQKLLPYGLDRLDAAAHDPLALVEGESDCWALWFHGFPALGLPGADTVKQTLAGADVRGVKKVYAFQEPGPSGETFVAKVRERLAELGWAGQLLVVGLDGVKDPSDFHKQNPDDFRRRFQQALDRAEPVDLAGARPWPDLLPLGETPPPAPFPLRVLPGGLRRVIEEGAGALGCPPDYLAVPVLTLAGASIGASRALAVKRGHVQRASLYSAVIGPPGSVKSPAQELVMEPVHEAEGELHTAWDEAMVSYEKDLETYESDLKDWRKGPKETRGEPPEKPRRPALKRLTVNDATAEALVPILQENPRGVAYVRDELTGWVQSMNQYREGGKGADQQFWLSAWSGATATVDRKKTHDAGPLRVRHPFVCVLGGLTPDKLPTLRGDRQRQRAELDGFIDRVLLSYPAEPRVEEETWLEVSDETRKALADLFAKLRSLEMVPVQEGEAARGWRPFVVHLTEGGRRAWQEFTRAHAAERNAEDFPPHLVGPWSKLRGYCARLALVLHFMRWACGEVTGEDVDGESVRAAAELVAYFKAHARRAHAVMDSDPRLPEARRLLRWVLQSNAGRFTRRDAYRAMRGAACRTVDDIDPILALLEKHGYIRPLEPQDERRPGRKASPAYEIHPGTPGQNGHNGRNDPASPCGDAGAEPDGPSSVHSVHCVPCPGGSGAIAEAGAPAGQGTAAEPQPAQGEGPATGPRVEVSDVPSAACTLVTEQRDLASVRWALDESAEVGLDIETTGLNPRTDRVRLLSLATERGTYLIDCSRVDVRELFEHLAEKSLVIHNGAFDLAFLARLGFVPGVVHDTMLLSQLLLAGTNDKHKLPLCVQRELGEALDKDEQKSDWSRPDLSPEQLAYAARDAEVLPRLFRAMTIKAQAAGLGRVAEIERRCLPALVWLAQAGVPFDRDTWVGLARQAEAETKALTELLDAAAGPRDGFLGEQAVFDWNSPAQVKQALAAVGVEVEDTTDEALAAADHPLAALVRAYRSATKRSTTYGQDWLAHVAPDGRVYAQWVQLGSRAGRMSCRDPNMQQIPRGEHRQCIRPPAGRVLVKADYSQIELRIAALVADERRMVAAFRQSEDLHFLTAQRVLGVKEVSRVQRQLAKAVNFGLLYGMGAKGFQIYARSNYGVTMTADEAKAYRNAFFRAYPGLTRWHRSVKDGEVETRTLTGRRRLGVSRFTEKLNTPVQGTGADGLKLALALLWERRGDCPGAVPVLAVHDEIVVEVDQGQAEAAGAWLKQAMLDAMTPLIDPVPVEVDVKAAPTWGG